MIVKRSNKLVVENRSSHNDTQQVVVADKLYSENIRTLRLVNNELHDIEKFKEEDSEEEEEEKQEEDS